MVELAPAYWYLIGFALGALFLFLLLWALWKNVPRFQAWFSSPSKYPTPASFSPPVPPALDFSAEQPLPV